MNGFTPGKWILHNQRDDMWSHQYSIHKESGGVIALVDPAAQNPNGKDDLMLMTAAPAMYEALRDAQSWLSEKCPRTIQDNIAAALSDAVGEPK